MDPRADFGHRLSAAMEAVGLAPRPSVLLKLFNARYWGRSVTFQAASRWLRGQAIPEHDKLLVLAEVLQVEPEILRYGGEVRRSLLDRQHRWEEGAGYLERDTVDVFLQLPEEQRRLIRETVLLFAKANAVGVPEQSPKAKSAWVRRAPSVLEESAPVGYRPREAAVSPLANRRVRRGP